MQIHGVDIKLTKNRAELLKSGWEFDRIRSMIANIAEGDIVFDVGAEQGDISALLGIKSKNIVLFEPSPVMWPHIIKNFVRNDIQPISCFPGFASDVTNITGKEDFRGVWPEYAFDKLKNERSFRHLNEHSDSVDQITIDDFVRDTKLIPNVITIDVEGSEWLVLQGAQKTLEQHKPLLYVSIHHELMWKMYGKWFHDIWWEYLRNFGYKMKLLSHDHESHYVFYDKSMIEMKEII